MKQSPYLVTAECRNPRCGTGLFTEHRRSIVKRSTCGQDYRISVLVCPLCRQWAPIVEIEAPDEKVAS